MGFGLRASSSLFTLRPALMNDLRAYYVSVVFVLTPMTNYKVSSIGHRKKVFFAAAKLLLVLDYAPFSSFLFS